MTLTLSPAAWQHAWKASFRASLADLPDAELRWERDRWRSLRLPLPAAIVGRELAEREEFDLHLPGGAFATDLDLLWQRSDQDAVLDRCQRDGMSLVVSLRVGYWTKAGRQ